MNIIVSSCLLGENCRYDGNNNFVEIISEYLHDFNLIGVCPEILGGLPIPRPPAEIQDGLVITSTNIDVTKNFYFGAQKTLEIAKLNDVKIAILKEKSPSCGSTKIYDGTFSKSLIKGEGVTTSLLRKNNIIVLNEHNFIDFFKNI